MSESSNEKYRFWDAYWQDSRVYSAGPDAFPEIEMALDTNWSQVVESLNDKSRVLDLACGNGAVGLSMMRAARQMGKSISVVGVDAAAIDPPRYVTRHKDLLSKIEFHPRTLIEELPFSDGEFDGVFSQFGIEYADIRLAVSELGRVLKPGAVVLILALPATSVVIQ